MKKNSPDGTMDRPVVYMATHVYKDTPVDPLHAKHIAAKEIPVGNIYALRN